MPRVQPLANPYRIKAAHRRRRRIASGPIVQRYYDPGYGRFLSVDPVTAYGGDYRHFNRYAYAYNNPYKFTDPDGRCPDACVIEGGVVISAGVVYVGAAALVATGVCIVTCGAIKNSIENSARDAKSKILDFVQNSDGPTTSDREAGSDGKKGSTGGPGAGKRFPKESPEAKAAKEGVPCRYCGIETTNQPGKPNSRERDHIDARSRDGNNLPDNEGDSCRTCNRSKGAKNPDEFGKPYETIIR